MWGIWLAERALKALSLLSETHSKVEAGNPISNDNENL